MKFGLQHSALAAAACACVGAGVAAPGCIIVPPPDLPNTPVRPPRILHDSVSPPADVPLADWPDVFIVPVEMEDPDPTAKPQYEVFVGPSANPSALFANMPPAQRPPDGGLATVQFTIDTAAQNIDRGVCHTIRVNVTDPDTRVPGGDSVTWVYGGSGAPYGCPVHDAGALQDGRFPDDSSVETLPIPPEGGPGQ